MWITIVRVESKNVWVDNKPTEARELNILLDKPGVKESRTFAIEKIVSGNRVFAEVDAMLVKE